MPGELRVREERILAPAANRWVALRKSRSLIQILFTIYIHIHRVIVSYMSSDSVDNFISL